MSASNKIQYELLSNMNKNEEKERGVLTNHVTLRAYKKHICEFSDWAKGLGIRRIHEIAQQGYTPVSLVQKYTDELVARGLKPTTVHTYVAPICKGFGIGMEQISKPRRLSKDIVKNTKQHQNAAGEKQMNDLRNARLVRFAEIVTVRGSALVRLTIDSLKKDENGDYIIAVRDKGGKESIQLLMPEEVDFVRKTLSEDRDGKPLKKGERPFSNKDRKQMPLGKFRIERAQRIEAAFERKFNAWRDMPSKTRKDRNARAKAQKAAQMEKEKWVVKIMGKYAAAHPKKSPQAIEKYRKQLLNPSRISLRGGNRERAKALGRPTDYDRVAVKIASVYALSHWEDESTIRNYLTK